MHQHAAVVVHRLGLLYTLAVDALVELTTTVWLNVHLRQRVLTPLHHLQNHHRVVVEDVQEEQAVDQQRHYVLDSRTVVVLVDVICVDLGADENELNEDEGG